MSDLTRRNLLGAVAAGGLVAASAVDAADEKSKYKGDEAIPPFRYSLEAAKPGHVTPGGSAREATVKQLPISKGLAGVSMRLEPGGFRELHWHAIAAEWAYVLEGRVRTTVIDPNGDDETLDFWPGDVWFFPRGHGHMVQGRGPGVAHFILGFDDGAFSEFGTFSVTDWLAVTPPDVLAKNLGVPADTFAKFPKREVYIGKGKVPPPLPAEPPAGTLRSSPLTHKYQLAAQRPRKFPGGHIRLVSSREFPISSTMTGATMRLEPGALRELHWHPNADEWQYVIKGQARVALFGSNGRARTEELERGDVCYVPRGFGHYVENTGDKDCEMLLIFNSGVYQEISLTAWLASNPQQLVAEHFGVSEEVVARFPKKTAVITSREGAKP